jgi:hypothetical protein
MNTMHRTTVQEWWLKKKKIFRDMEVQSFWPPFVVLVCRALNELASRWKVA